MNQTRSWNSRPLVFGAGLLAAGCVGAFAQDKGWESSASLGATLTRGNSDTFQAIAQILTQKKWDRNEVRLGADGTYGEQEIQGVNQRTAQSLHGFAQYNRLFSDRFYGYARVDGLHDSIADIDYRITLSPGVGYYFIKNEATSLSGEVGPGFVYEKQGGNTTGYVTLRVAERFEHKLNDRVRIWQSLEWLPQVDDFNNWILNAEAGIESKLTDKLSLKVFALDTYDNEPAPGRQENDLKVVTAIGYTF